MRLLFPSLLVAALTVSASAAGKLPPNVAKTAKAAKAASNGKSKPAPAPPQPQPTPAQPVVPLRPSQMPSVAPRVSYQQGMLTVVAENSTISDILGAIRSATGIRIESVGGPSGDRVAAKIGPARPREVLLSLLQGSRFDYVMLGSASDPERIERVILSPKLGATPAPPPQAVAQQQQQEQVRDTDQENDPVDLTQPDTEEAGAPPLKGEEPPPNDQPQPGNPQQEGPPQNSTNPNPPMNQAQPNPQQQGQGQQGQEVKTPEQLLEELRMRQQQQQQQQQQQYQQQPQQQEQQQPEQQQQPPEQQQDQNPKQ